MTGKPVIVIVTDSETMAVRLRMIIEAEGGTAMVTRTADQARGAIQAERPRAIVADPSLVAKVTASASGLPVLSTGEWEPMRHRLAEALADHSGEAEEMASALARARILIVDDSVTYREFLRHELSSGGAVVTVCGDSVTALDLMAHERFDAVLIDLVMPGMGGLALCAAAASLRRRLDCPFSLLVLSSREGRDDLLRSLEAGADAYLSKAQDMPTLRARIGAHLRRSRLVLERIGQ